MLAARFPDSKRLAVRGMLGETTEDYDYQWSGHIRAVCCKGRERRSQTFFGAAHLLWPATRATRIPFLSRRPWSSRSGTDLRSRTLDTYTPRHCTRMAASC